MFNLAVIGSTATGSSSPLPADPVKYVAEGAGGGGDGSTGTPWTLAEFEAETFASQTTIEFRATATTWTISTNGNGITFPDNTTNTVRAGDTVKISGSGTGASNRCDYAFDLEDASSVSIDGFTVDGGGATYDLYTVSAVASVAGSTNCTIKNCTISKTYGTYGIYIDDLTTTTPSGFSFIDNTWTDHGVHYDIDATLGDNGNGFHIVRGENIRITGNTFVRTGGHSTIEVRRCNNLWIAENTFDCDWSGVAGVNADGQSRAIELKANGTSGGTSDGNYNWLVEKNELFDCGGQNDNSSTTAFKIGGQYGVFRDNLVTRVDGNAYALLFLCSSTGNFMENIYGYNNTITNTAAGAFQYLGDTAMSGTPGRVEFFNNICQDQRNDPSTQDYDFRITSIGVLDVFSAPPTIVDYNIFDQSADVRIEDSSGPDSQTLTSMELNNPTEVNNNDQSNVISNFTSSTGDTRADYAYAETGGRAQTTVSGSDTGTGTTLLVGNTRMFKDTMNGLRPAGDQIYVGGTLATINTIDSDTQITLTSSISRSASDDVIWAEAYSAGSVLRGVVDA